MDFKKSGYTANILPTQGSFSGHCYCFMCLYCYRYIRSMNKQSSNQAVQSFLVLNLLQFCLLMNDYTISNSHLTSAFNIHIYMNTDTGCNTHKYLDRLVRSNSKHHDQVEQSSPGFTLFLRKI